MVLYIKKVKDQGLNSVIGCFGDMLLCIGICTVFDVICMCHYSGDILSTNYKLQLTSTENVVCSLAFPSGSSEAWMRV